MATNEETLLKEYYHSLSTEAEDVAEPKLNAAIRSGMARSRNTFSLKARYGLGMVAMLAILLLFSFPRTGEVLKQQSAALTPPPIAQSNMEFEEYFAKAINNTTVSSAIEAGLVKRVNGVTAEKNGFVLTVDGIAADRKGIIILYSLLNKTGQRATVDALNLTGSGLNPLHTSPANASSGTTFGYEVMQWGGEFNSLPEQITLELKLGKTKQLSAVAGNSQLAQLSVPIPLDRDQIAKTGETINIDKTLTIDGQEIAIKEVYIAASGIYLDYFYNPQNSKQIFSMFKPHILLGSNGDYSHLELRNTQTAEGKNSMVFANDSLSLQPLQLQIDGILALNKDATELIIDTEKQEIIKSPDQNLKMRMNNNEKDSTMILEYYPKPEQTKVNNTLMIDIKFKDKAGQVHSASEFNISIPPRTELKGDSVLPVLEYMGLGSNKYSQPLTFNIVSYPNLIKQKLSLPVRK